MRKKIFIVTTVPETFASILKDQPRYLSQYFKVELVTSPDNKSHIIDEGLKIHRVPMNRGISLFRDLISVLKMVSLIIKERPYAIHSYTPKAGLVSMLAAWICRVPVRIHTFTGLIFPTQNGFKQKLLIWIDRLICVCATRIVPEGEGVKQDLIKYNITSKPLGVIGYGNIAGVDLSYFNAESPAVSRSATELTALLNIKSDDFVFCFVGRLNKDKGLSELSEAFAKMPGNVQLLIVGDHDPSAPINPEVIDFFESHPRVNLLGFQKDIRPALYSSNILILPSYREGFPNVVLQAGAMGLPCIVTNINGCNEIIAPGYNGWLVPPKDECALSKAMLESLTTSPVLLKQMGENAKLRVTSRFNRNDHFMRMATFYKEEINV
ncbi:MULTISPECIES: glycosyltransferase family 4 protein [unclassified Pseudomonas]|uniref:glycosyltransferase family 4 protein n=1 Tax=unclassified Pseudomonas TaxID=196821 RepID=UPI00385F8EEC